jgi:hypothetical protein
VQVDEFKYAALLRYLYITDCSTFSVEALKTLVKGRHGVLRKLLGFYGDEPENFELVVSGNVPDFSYEDISWFRERLPMFEYKPSRKRRVSQMLPSSNAK